MYSLLLHYYATATPNNVTQNLYTGQTQAQCIVLIDAANSAGVITRVEMKGKF